MPCLTLLLRCTGTRTIYACLLQFNSLFKNFATKWEFATNNYRGQLRALTISREKEFQKKGNHTVCLIHMQGSKEYTSKEGDMHHVQNQNTQLQE
jgi:hypothetical protein